jgi:hypothetical protein
MVALAMRQQGFRQPHYIPDPTVLIPLVAGDFCQNDRADRDSALYHGSYVSGIAPSLLYERKAVEEMGIDENKKVLQRFS